jgi:hypothetical protein
MINNASMYAKFVDLLEEFKKDIMKNVRRDKENTDGQLVKKELRTEEIKEKLKKIKYHGRKVLGLGDECVSANAFAIAHSHWITHNEVYAHTKLPKLRSAILRLSRGNGSVCYLSPEKMIEFYLSEEGKNLFPRHYEALQHFIRNL